MGLNAQRCRLVSPTVAVLMVLQSICSCLLPGAVGTGVAEFRAELAEEISAVFSVARNVQCVADLALVQASNSY